MNYEFKITNCEVKKSGLLWLVILAKRWILIFVLAPFLMFSCANDTKISTYTASYSDFVNSLTVEGVVEAVSSSTLVTPRIYDGSILLAV